MNREQEPPEDDFWTIDEELGELELKERPGGPDLYTVCFKARTSSLPYQPDREIYPLEVPGTEHEVSGKAYILVPDLTLSVGLFPTPQPSGAIGTVTSSDWRGMRHHDIANLRGLYYDEDQALAVWEVDAWGRLEEFAHAQLWQHFERFLTDRFPQAWQIFADDAEPGEDERRNREFLRGLGYEHVAGTHRIWSKEVRRR